MQSFLLAAIILDGPHATGLGFSLNEAMLAAAMNAQGVSAKLYTGKPEGRVIDLVRQLLRARAHTYLFRVSNETAATVAVLSEGIRANRPDAMFVFWFRDQQVDMPIQTQTLAGLGCIVAGHAAGEVIRVLQNTGAILPIPSFIDTTLTSSPYIQGLLGREQAVGMGFIAKQPWPELKAELDWFRHTSLTSSETVTIIADELTESELLALAANLQTQNSEHDVQVRLNSAMLTSSVCVALRAAGVEKVSLCDDGTTLPAYLSDLGLEVAKRERTPDESFARRLEYGRNGVVALHTGLYSSTNPSGGIQHLELSSSVSKAVRDTAYEWAQDQLLLRNALTYHAPQDMAVEQMGAFESPVTEETGGWPKHSYFIGERSHSKAKIYFDGQPATEQSIQYVPFHSLSSANSQPSEVTFVSMAEADDLNEFERQLAQFHNFGTIAVGQSRLQFFYENACRWLTNGACSLTLLRRIQVMPNERVRACRDSGDIGGLSDSYESMLTLMKQRKQLESVRRSCEICPVRDECSQCVHLPESWGGRYCEIRVAYPQTALFLRLSQFSQKLRQMTQDAGDGSSMAFSYRGLPAQFYLPAGEAWRDGEQPVLASYKSSHYAWWPGSQRIVRLSEPLACMAEAWWRGANEIDVISELSKRYAVTLEVAEENWKAGLTLLSKEGVIHV